MSVIVIVPPAPFMTPAGIPGSHASDDAIVQAWIDAAVAELDGPDGWLGIAIGEQTLEYRLSGFPCTDGEISLPCKPIISLTSIIYTDPEGAEKTMGGADYQFSQKDGIVRPAINAAWPTARNVTGSVKIRYVAGFNGGAVADGGTGEIPTRIRQGVVLLTQMYRNSGVETMFLSEVTLPGVETRKFVVSEESGKVVRSAVQSLLAPLRQYW